VRNRAGAPAYGAGRDLGGPARSLVAYTR
jgi:hypothetical protein